MPEELDQQEQEQDDLVRPPDLNRETSRSATRLELFFDLAFLLYVARCAEVLAEHATWAAAVEFVALMTVGWWAWASATLFANRFDTDDAVFRLLTLAGMAGVVGMAAGVDAVRGPDGRWFALAYAVLRIVLVLGYARAWWHVPEARATIRPYLIGHAAGGALWLISAAVPEPARYVLWAAGVAVDLIGPALAGRVRDGVPLHKDHLPERFGLFVILVLGEAVAAVVTGLHDATWGPASTLSAGLAFLAGTALWWIYFDLAGGAAKRRLLRAGDENPTQGVHGLYVYAHLPLAIGLVAVAVGLEHAVLHGADDHLDPGARWVIALGAAGYLATSAFLQGVMAGQVRASVLWPGLGVPLVLLIGLVDAAPPVLLALLAAVLVAGVVAGILTRRAGELRTAKA